MDARELIERGVAHYRQLIAQRPALAAELAQAREQFRVGPPHEEPGSDEEQLFERRLLEHFVFERFSEHAQGVPVEALSEAWRAAAGPELAELEDVFLGSLAGVFEVTGIQASGLWLRDLLGRGEYPTQEAEAAQELAEGDVLVGRLHPVGDASYRLSPAATCYRNSELLSALQSDLEQARQSRRGVLRIQQSELERMFHARQADGPQRIEAARAFLAAGGLDEETIAELFEHLARSRPTREELAPGHGDVLGAILDRLAFETELDLDRTRELLIGAWSALLDPPAEGADSKSGSGAPKAPAPTAALNGSAPAAPVARSQAPMDAASALAAFDDGRSQGRDLEQLFDELERNLGIESSEAEEDGAPPAFPGVVAALVGEFRWELSHEEGEASLPGLAHLDELARFAAHVEQPEELGVDELVGFAAAHCLDAELLRGEEDALAMLQACMAFARWANDTQSLPLESEFAELERTLKSSLPRILRARAGLERPQGEGRVFRVEREAGGLELVDREGERYACQLDPECASWLRSGDLLRTDQAAAGRVTRAALYPPEAVRALEPALG